MNMKKNYIKPSMEVISVYAECEGGQLPTSYSINTPEGKNVGSGTIIENEMPGDAEDDDHYNPWD